MTATKLAGLPAWVSKPDPSLYWSDNYLILDFETTNLFKGSPLIDGNKLVLACWTYKGKSYSHFGSEYDQGDLVRDIGRADFVVAHNAKFELGWLRRCGIDLRKIITFDTMIAEYVIGGNTFSLQHLSLSACLARAGFEAKEDMIGRMFKAGINTVDMPESWLLTYCIRDVEATGELFLTQRYQLKELGLEAVNYQRNLVTPALADIEFSGIQLDKEKVHEAMDTVEEEYARTTAELQEFCEGASPTSAKQLAPYVYDQLNFSIPLDYKRKPMLTPSGNPSVAIPVMDRLRPTTERQKDFLRMYREWSAMHSDVTKYLRKFGDCCREVGGLIFGGFNQCNTRTHRLSSSGLEYKIQFQNLNRRFKPLFCARKAGWLVGEADGAQLEFRVAAHLGKDRVALADIISGRDIHSFTASIIGCDRQSAKVHTFKPLYGGKSGTPKEQEYYKYFEERYHQIAAEQRSWAVHVSEHKELRTEWGMRYYWPLARMSENGYVSFTTSIYNYPVQAFATAEIIPIAIVCAWHRMSGLQSFLVNTVHDSIIAELHPDEVDLWHEVAKQCLITDTYNLINLLYGVRLTVPLGAGVTVASHWGSKEAKDSEIVYEAPEELWKPAAEKEGMI